MAIQDITGYYSCLDMHLEQFSVNNNFLLWVILIVIKTLYVRVKYIDHLPLLIQRWAQAKPDSQRRWQYAMVSPLPDLRVDVYVYDRLKIRDHTDISIMGTMGEVGGSRCKGGVHSESRRTGRQEGAQDQGSLNCSHSLQSMSLWSRRGWVCSPPCPPSRVGWKGGGVAY